MRELETQLGFRLFDRTTRHVVPTAHGTELLAVAQKSVAALDAAVSHIGREQLISLRSFSPIQQIVDKHPAQAGVVSRQGVSITLLDTQIAMVEADEGIAIIPSFGLPACRDRKVVTSRLINPVVDVESHQISNRGKKLPPGADEFSAFLKSFLARELATSVPRNVAVGTHDTSGGQRAVSS